MPLFNLHPPVIAHMLSEFLQWKHDGMDLAAWIMLLVQQMPITAVAEYYILLRRRCKIRLWNSICWLIANVFLMFGSMRFGMGVTRYCSIAARSMYIFQNRRILETLMRERQKHPSIFTDLHQHQRTWVVKVDVYTSSQEHIPIIAQIHWPTKPVAPRFAAL